MRTKTTKKRHCGVRRTLVQILTEAVKHHMSFSAKNHEVERKKHPENADNPDN